MGLNTTWKINGNQEPVYIKIDLISTRKGNLRYTNETSSGNSVTNEFNIQVDYIVKPSKDSEEIIATGNLTCPYEIAHSENLWEFCYNQLKSKVNKFKDATDL